MGKGAVIGPMKNLSTSDFDYKLPPEFIAQTPIEPRDSSRLMILDRENGRLIHTRFTEIGKFLNPGDLLVINQSRVLLARLPAKKVPSGGKVELLLLEKKEEKIWEVMVGGKGLKVGKQVQVDSGPGAQIISVLDGPCRLVRFSEAIEAHLASIGQVPLPPYIHQSLSDPQRYQTVYANEDGSAAAPTAGLHFTEELIENLGNDGILFATVTLHIGLDTFAPVTEKTPLDHKIHSELCQLDAENAAIINDTHQAGGKIVAVGTTSVRTLETAARNTSNDDIVAPFEGPTDLFILPGYEFKVVNSLVTNFHLPKSTLIMLVSAFAGRDKILEAYEVAKEEIYRFYSFGDAMLIL